MGDNYYGEIRIPKRFIKGSIAKHICDETGVSEEELKKELSQKPSGIFIHEDNEARSGQFSDLEDVLEKAGVPFDRRSGCYDCYAPLKRIFRPESACGVLRQDVCQANDEHGAAYYKADGLKQLLLLKPATLKRRLRKNLKLLLLDETSPLELWGKGKIKPLRRPNYNIAA